MTAAELITRYTDIRRRLYGKPVVVNIRPRLNPEPTPELEPAEIIQLPVPVIRKKHRTMRQIAELVCRFYRVTMDDLRSVSRKNRVVYPRQCAMYWMHRIGDWSYPQIGMFFGRDHTTVLHGVREHAKRRAKRNAQR